MIKAACIVLWAICSCVSHVEAVTAQPAVIASRVAREEIVEAEQILPLRPLLPPSKAIAELRSKGNTITGNVHFLKVDEGVRITAKVDGLSPGKHGFHIHEYADCRAPEGTLTGGEFNPTHKKHGGPDHLERHIGDLGNLVADSDGHAEYERIDSVISLAGPHTILGHSIVIHALADDYKTEPSGNAGGRIACGPIVAN